MVKKKNKRAIPKLRTRHMKTKEHKDKTKYFRAAQKEILETHNDLMARLADVYDVDYHDLINEEDDSDGN